MERTGRSGKEQAGVVEAGDPSAVGRPNAEVPEKPVRRRYSAPVQAQGAPKRPTDAPSQANGVFCSGVRDFTRLI